MADRIMPDRFPMPSGLNSSKIDEEKLKSYTFKDLVWALKILDDFRKAREGILEIMKVLAEAGVDTSKINWNDPFSVMSAFMQVKGMNVDVDIEEIIEFMEGLNDVSFADVNKAIDIIETFLALSSKAERVAKIVRKRGYTAKEFDMLMGLLGLGGSGSGSSVKINVEEFDEEDERELEITEEELDRIKSIINKYRHKSGNQ